MFLLPAVSKRLEFVYWEQKTPTEVFLKTSIITVISLKAINTYSSEQAYSRPNLFDR